MMLVIVRRRVPAQRARLPATAGLAWSNEMSEHMLYCMTMLAAPWLLRQGQHIRVDILLRALPRAAGLVLRVGRRHARPRLLLRDRLVCGFKAALVQPRASRRGGKIKTLVTRNGGRWRRCRWRSRCSRSRSCSACSGCTPGERGPRADAVTAA